MARLLDLNKGKWVAALLVITYYLFGALFFFVQGVFINSVINKSSANFIWLIVSLVLCKVLMMVSNIFQQNLKNYLSIVFYGRQMQHYYPERIYSDFCAQSSSVFDSLHDCLSKQYECVHDIFINRFGFSFVLILYLALLMHTQFVLGGLTILVLMCSVFFCSSTYNQQLEEELDSLSEKRQALMQWNKEYFSAYNEISKVWPDKVKQKYWFKQVLHEFIENWQQVTKTLFINNLLCQLFVEFPFALLICLIFIGVYYDKISIPQAFVWLGLSQFMLSACLALVRNGELKKLQANYVKRIAQVCSIIGNTQSAMKIDLINKSQDCYEFLLQNKKCITLSLAPGMCWIENENGSGKTTLLNTISGFDRSSPYDLPEMYALKSLLSTESIRIIDREAILFSCFDCFEKQITGEGPSELTDQIESNLMPLLPQDLLQQWIILANQLRAKFESNTKYHLSLGEQVMLSCLRNWYAWTPQVKLLLVDECDSCLDTTKKSLFSQTLQCLSQHICVYAVSHSKQNIS